MPEVFIGLGSNLGDRLENLKRAVVLLGENGLTVEKVSSVYETDPVGPPQPDFLNAAVKGSTDLAPDELLATLKRLEREMDRTAGERWGPREIDLDLLLYADLVLESEELCVPHADLTKRDFVMVPLLEIEPDLELPSGEPLTAFSSAEPEGTRRFGTLTP